MKITKESRKRRLWIVFKVLIVPIFFLIIIVIYLFTFFFDLFVTPKPEETKQESYVETTKETKIQLDKLDNPNPQKEEILQKEEPPENIEPKDEIVEITNKNWWEYPDTILETTRSGKDLLVLVNKKYRLPSTFIPSHLVDVKSIGIRTKNNGAYYVRNILIKDLKSLDQHAKEDGIDLSVVSAYRSYATQASTYQYWVNYNGGDVAAADTVSARPGHSQHQLGTAIDFSSSEIGDRLGSEFDNTKASKWLEENAWRFGFVIAYPKGYESVTKYSYESWHYRYVGISNSTKIHQENAILETFLKAQNI